MSNSAKINLDVITSKDTDQSKESEPTKNQVNEPKPTKKLEINCSRVVKKICKRVLIKSCFPVNSPTINKIIIFFTISFIVWAFTFLVAGQAALPGGLYFSLIILVICAHILGYLMAMIKIPPLLGMLLVGIFFKNVPVVSIIGQSVDSSTSSILRL